MRNSKGQFVKGQHWREPHLFREREWLMVEYVEKQRSSKNIAQEFKVTDAAVLFWLRRNGIERRTVSDARKVKYWGIKGKDNPMFGKTGNSNPNYKDGSSPERQRLYASHEWKELVKRIYARDEYRCKRCGDPHTRQNTLHAHHIKAWAEYPELRFKESNLITLCNYCHNYVHSKKNINGEFL